MNDEPRLSFLSGYQGESDYLVDGGGLTRARIRVRWRTASKDASDFASYRTPTANLEHAQSAGCVIGPDVRVPVPYAVLVAVRRLHAERLESLRAAGFPTEHYSPEIAACRWAADGGFERVADSACPGHPGHADAPSDPQHAAAA